MDSKIKIYNIHTEYKYSQVAMNTISKASNSDNQSDSSCQIRNADIILLQNKTPKVRLLRQFWPDNGKQHSMCFMESFVHFGFFNHCWGKNHRDFNWAVLKTLHYIANSALTQHLSTDHVCQWILTQFLYEHL